MATLVFGSKKLKKKMSVTVSYEQQLMENGLIYPVVFSKICNLIFMLRVQFEILLALPLIG